MKIQKHLVIFIILCTLQTAVRSENIRNLWTKGENIQVMTFIDKARKQILQMLI